MQNISIRLFSSAYDIRSRVERFMLLMAFVSVALHGWLLYHLIAVNDFRSALLFLYLFSLLPFCLFMLAMWLDRNPDYQRHLTLSETGVRYRSGLMQQEHEFDWEEVDTIRLEPVLVTFLLKNGEVHEVSIKAIRNGEVLQEARSRITRVAASKGIEVILPQV
jgi:hypothetical protein